MRRSCDSCGKPYEAKRKASRFCSDTCRKRNQRTPAQPLTPIEDAMVSAGLVNATVRELEAADRLDSVLGRQALELARRIASPHETGASVASLSKEFRAVMEVAMDGVGIAVDPLDELRTRREHKRNVG